MRRVTSSDLFRSPIHLLAFGFGTGMSPVAPGTLGTLAAVPIVWAHSALPDSLSAVVVLVFTVAGVHICQVAADTLGTHDHPGIVWDEMAGVMGTLLVVTLTKKYPGGSGLCWMISSLRSSPVSSCGGC